MSTTAEFYVNTYFTTRLESARRANEKAAAKLTGEYQSQIQARAALQAEAQKLHAERVVIEEGLIEWQKLKQEGRTKGMSEASSTQINEWIRTLRETSVQLSVRSSEDRDRATKVVIADVERRFDIPAATSTLITTAQQEATAELATILRTAKPGANNEVDATTQGLINGAITGYLDTVSRPADSLAEGQHRVTAAVQARAGLEELLASNNIKVPAGSIDARVAKAYGLRPEQTTDAYLTQAKQALEKEALDKAYANTDPLRQTYNKALQELSRLLGVDEEAMRARAEIAAQMTPEAWAELRADLMKDGILNEVAPELRDQYLALREAGGALSPQDDVLFDDLFLRQLQRSYQLQEGETALQEQAAAINPVAPTDKDIRQLAYQLQPRGQMPMPALVDRPGLNAAQPNPNVSGKDQTMAKALNVAQSVPADANYKPSLTARRIHNQIVQGALPRTQLYETAAKLTGDPTPVITDVIWLDLQGGVK